MNKWMKRWVKILVHIICHSYIMWSTLTLKRLVNIGFNYTFYVLWKSKDLSIFYKSSALVVHDASYSSFCTYISPDTKLNSSTSFSENFTHLEHYEKLLDFLKVTEFVGKEADHGIFSFHFPSFLLLSLAPQNFSLWNIALQLSLVTYPQTYSDKLNSSYSVEVHRLFH